MPPVANLSSAYQDTALPTTWSCHATRGAISQSPSPPSRTNDSTKPGPLAGRVTLGCPSAIANRPIAGSRPGRLALGRRMAASAPGNFASSMRVGPCSVVYLAGVGYVSSGCSSSADTVTRHAAPACGGRRGPRRARIFSVPHFATFCDTLHGRPAGPQHRAPNTSMSRCSETKVGNGRVSDRSSIVRSRCWPHPPSPKMLSADERQPFHITHAPGPRSPVGLARNPVLQENRLICKKTSVADRMADAAKRMQQIVTTNTR